MTEIYCMTQIHKYWNETICLAEKCSWKAGPYLAQKMKSNDFNTWERVFVACVNGKVAGFCTLAEKDELPKEYPFTPFIGFVFVDEPYRGNRLSELMIQSAILYARELGYEKVYVLGYTKNMVLKSWVIVKQYLAQLISYLLSQQYDN